MPNSFIIAHTGRGSVPPYLRAVMPYSRPR